jgi:uncharacterized protein (TIGR02145 family)
MKTSGIVLISTIALAFFGCKIEQIILPGDIKGLVSDASNYAPIGAASVILNQLNDSAITGTDGIYQFKNLSPGQYSIQASKLSYATIKMNITVSSAKTNEINFPLNEIPSPEFSVPYLDFGIDSSTLDFAISNSTNEILTYIITTSQDWITVYPIYGEIKNDTNTIRVTIDRSSLSKINKYKETIQITTNEGVYYIYVYLNGFFDKRDSKYYKEVRIGNQTWMAENLNFSSPIVPRYCYNNDTNNCSIYGSLYNWNEMMQNAPADEKPIGTTQGVCPVGWHLPTNLEFQSLIGLSNTDSNLKEAGSIWNPNPGDNASGFSALPGGSMMNLGHDILDTLGYAGRWLSSSKSKTGQFPYYSLYLTNSTIYANIQSTGNVYCSVRCVKNPGKK